MSELNLKWWEQMPNGTPLLQQKAKELTKLFNQTKASNTSKTRLALVESLREYHQLFTSEFISK